MNGSLLNKGRDLLNSITSLPDPLNCVKDELLIFEGNEQSIEEAQSWFVCVVALHAVASGNFGVGAALFDEHNELIEYAGNAVFSPEFRSDGHAEMMVLTKLEEKHTRRIDLKKSTLVTSLESCPMCLVRIISAKVGHLLHVSDDDIGGMTRNRATLPKIWRELYSGMEFRKTLCPERLRVIASLIFENNVVKLKDSLSG